jgi:cytochrome c oxidase subunit 3
MPRVQEIEELDELELEIEELEHGGGTPPPPHDHDGGDDNSQPPGRHGPHNRLRRYRIGLLVSVVSIYFLFFAITIVFVLRYNTGPFDPNTGENAHDWQHVEVPSILWFNTLVLLLSSVTLERARKLVFDEQYVISDWLGVRPGTRRASLPWLCVSAFLGWLFLAGQFVAWMQLQQQGIYASKNTAGSFFYIVTATHAVHLTGGLIAIFWALLVGGYMTLQSRQITVDVTTWYWHAMGLLWVYVFALLHFLR